MLCFFRQAVAVCEWPHPGYAAIGGENFDVAHAMLEARGTGQRRVLAGSRVHNQIIEHCVCLFFVGRVCYLNPDLFALHGLKLPCTNSVRLGTFELKVESNSGGEVCCVLHHVSKNKF